MNQRSSPGSEYAALADKYQDGLDKCLASGYEEFGPKFIREREMVIRALRAQAACATDAAAGAQEPDDLEIDASGAPPSGIPRFPAATPSNAWSASTHDEIIKRLMAGVGMPNSSSLYVAFKQFANELHALSHDAAQASPELIEGLNAAIRAANLALFVIRKQGVMPNSSWETGFENDMTTARNARNAALAIPSTHGAPSDAQFESDLADDAAMTSTEGK